MWSVISSGRGAGRVHEGWACYHTELLAFERDGVGEVGIVGCAVGAPFAVLVAEQLFASDCRLLVSVTSAGQINPIGPRHFWTASSGVADRSRRNCIGARPGRRTPPIARPKRPSRVLATWGRSMEAAALYAFSTTSGNSIVCFAHVTNSMAQAERDFEKGEADGAKATLAVVAAAARGSRG